mgnify:CR=1 FL=1
MSQETATGGGWTQYINDPNTSGTTTATTGYMKVGAWTTTSIPPTGYTTTVGTGSTVAYPNIDWETLWKDRTFRAAILHQIRKAFKMAWTCPRCQRIYAPSHQHCEVCNIIDRLEGR